VNLVKHGLSFPRDIQWRPQKREEDHFLRTVTTLARIEGWRYYHTYDSRGSVAGFPDLVLVRRGRLIFAELKTPDAPPPRAAQQDWLADLALCSCAEVFVWRPVDWPQIVRTLSKDRRN
jgi:hypothetical protein